MANICGIRGLYHQLKRSFKKARDFQVRYWSLPSLKKTFSSFIGKTEITVDCFFGLGIQYSDLEYMLTGKKCVIIGSEVLRKVTRLIPFLVFFADSLYVKSICNKVS